MNNKTDWNAKAAREGERRREERPRHLGDVVVRYHMLRGAYEGRAEVIIEPPGRSDVVIGPLRSEVAREVFDLIRTQPKREPTVEEIRGYKPVCPRGYTDCVYDPAYIKHHHPEWYADLYGDKTPEEAIHEEGECYDRVRDDPEMKLYCYDDEDK
jgi:hypothetical protein